MASSPRLSRSLSPLPSTSTYYICDPSSLAYPSPPAVVDQDYKLPAIYNSEERYSMTPPMDSHSPLPSFDALCQPEWAGSTVLHASSSGTAMPSILSSDYDSFSGYDTAPAPPYGHSTYHSHSQNTHSPTPPPSGSVPRSPDHSMPSAVSYMTTPPVLGPRIKLEHRRDYAQGLEVSHYPSPGSVHTAFATDSGSYAGSASGYISDGQSSWRTSEFQGHMDSDQYYDSAAATSPFAQDDSRPYRAARPRRAARRLTTREEANFQCEVKGCGKLFSRSYNFKAHMETHDEKREYPFPCMEDDCSKKFVRKTDLQRHHQSVHMKERNFKCDYCGRLFARKDTLRRHMEDGCSKRFDISTLDLRAESYDSNHNSMRQLGVSGGLPPAPITPLGSQSSALASITRSVRSRQPTDEHDQEDFWGR